MLPHFERRAREAAKLEGRTEGAEDVLERLDLCLVAFENELRLEFPDEHAVLVTHLRFAGRLRLFVAKIVEANRNEHRTAIERFVAQCRQPEEEEPTTAPRRRRTGGTK